MKFDTFLATVGDWGRFQKVKYTLICLTYMLPSIMVYTYSFTAAIPNFRCVNPAKGNIDRYNSAFNQDFDSYYKPKKEECDRTEKHLSLKECQRCYTRIDHINQSISNLTKCSKYVYDRKYYTKTLVEEVRISEVFLFIIIRSSGLWFAIVFNIDLPYKLYSSLVTWLVQSSLEY